MVVIGGGFAGSTIARLLEKDFDVVLIDTKEYFEYTPSILRVIVEPEHLSKIQVRHSTYLKKARILIGEVTHVTEKEVKVNNQNISFDYLALCSGSTYASPIKESHKVIPLRTKSLSLASERLRKAKSVLLIGAGLVGVELVAEIMEKYPEKKITIVHASSKILERNHPKTRKYVLKYFAKKKVKLILNEKVMSGKGNTYTTNKGTKIKADLTFFCTGITPSSHYLRNSSLKKSLLGNCIVVSKFLQLQHHLNIFSAGDVNNTSVEKTAQNAEEQAKVIAYNILALEKNIPFKEYQEKSTPLVISLGKNKGIFEYHNIIVTGFLPGILKSFIEWKEMRKYL